MTNQEILQTVLDKVLTKGYIIPFEKEHDDEVMTKYNITQDLKIQVSTNYTIVADYVPFEVIIFSLEFAKLLWGEERPCYQDQIHNWNQDIVPICMRCGMLKANNFGYWTEQLQQLVIQPDDKKIQFLGEFV